MMNRVLDIITGLMNLLGDGVFALMSFLSPAAALMILSAVLGWLMLLVWRFTSNQIAIKQARDQITAHLLSTRLFRDNLAVTFRAQRMILWHAGRLLGFSVKPMVLMAIPFTLVMAQIGLRYEFRPASPGDVIRVTASLKPAARADDLTAALMGPGSGLRLPEALRHDAHDPCRAEPDRTVDWRLTAASPGLYEITLGTGEDAIRMPIVVDGGLARISSARGGGWLDRVLYSAEPGIPSNSIFESIHVTYPHRSTPILGFSLHWLMTLFIASIVFALIFKPFMKVHV